MSLVNYECGKTWKNSCDKRGPMISVSARPNVNQESDTAAKRSESNLCLQQLFLHGPSMDHTTSGCYTEGPLQWKLILASSSFPFWLHSQLHHHMWGDHFHIPTPQLSPTPHYYPVMQKTLAWKQCSVFWPPPFSSLCFCPHSLLHIPTELEILPFLRTFQLLRPLIGCHLPPQSSAALAEVWPFLHLTLLPLLLNPQSPIRKTPCFWSPFKDMYS